MSANQALFIPELLLEVFRSIERGGADEPNSHSNASAKATLSRCVLVCKAWEELATDVLWQSIPSALYLLNILGPMTFLQDPEDQENPGWVFVDTIPNPDLVHRFDRLRGRILTLTHFDNMALGGYPSTIAKAAILFVMSALAKLPNSGEVYLLPRVRRVTWESLRPSLVSPLTYMVAPSTTHLSIHPWPMFWVSQLDSEQESVACGALLRTMMAIPCRLETFHFTYGGGGSMPQRLEEDMVHFLSAQRSLESAGLYFPLTAAIIEGLGASGHTLRSLETSIQLGETEFEIIKISDLIGTSFPRLENLSLRLLDSMIPGFSMSSFNSLLKLNSLRDFTIRSTNPISPLQAHQIEAMGKGWPVLERLVLEAWPLEPSDAVAPISILSALAQHLGHSLTHLYIDMRCLDVPLPEARGDVRFTRLRSLDIGRSSKIAMGSERAVANYLGSLCPKNLKITNSFRRMVWPPIEPINLQPEGWDEVARILNERPEHLSESREMGRVTL
ncbi:hypothetical protein FRC04_004166 [Tulasnella sp. 424]|nr:hypothetical protein FRC04_004166 [Tulasnella sp. 424]KAG8968907.1 hypothetical protein FRC05_001275 [Tulasnella sp. 425]